MQSFALGIEVSIAMSMAYTKEITFSSSSLAVFDSKYDILVRFSYKVFISRTPSIFANGSLEFAGLSIICNVYSDKID